MGNPPASQFLTVAETCKVLRLGRDTVYRALHTREIPSIRIGNQFRIPRGALDSLWHSGGGTDSDECDELPERDWSSVRNLNIGYPDDSPDAPT